MVDGREHRRPPVGREAQGAVQGDSEGLFADAATAEELDPPGDRGRGRGRTGVGGGELQRGPHGRVGLVASALPGELPSVSASAAASGAPRTTRDTAAARSPALR